MNTHQYPPADFAKWAKTNTPQIKSCGKIETWNNGVDSYAFSSVLLDVDRFNVRFHEPQKILDAHLRCPRFSDSFWVLFWVYSIFLFTYILAAPTLEIKGKELFRKSASQQTSNLQALPPTIILLTCYLNISFIITLQYYLINQFTPVKNMRNFYFIE